MSSSSNKGMYKFLVICSCRDQVGRAKCPIDPYFIVPDKCKCVDFQMLKMQESPDAVPNGELPRHIQLYCDRYLTDKVVPGNRITVLGIYSIKKISMKAGKVRWCLYLCMYSLTWFIQHLVYPTPGLSVTVHEEQMWSDK